MKGGAMKKDFLISEAIRYGWVTMKANFWFFVGVLIIAWLVVGVPSGIASALVKQSAGLAFLFRIIGWAANIIISIGVITIALKFLNNEKPRLEDLFSFQPFFWHYLLAAILVGLIVTAGFLLLAVPGIYWAIKYQFFGYLVVDRKLKPMEALKQSAKITANVKWKLLGFGLILACINILGVMCLIIGVFATIPTTLLAFAYAYRKLLSQTEIAQPPQT